MQPRDHILALAYMGSGVQTDPTKISAKVRVNGGAATIYTSATNPAIVQLADCLFAYLLEIPAGTYTDGDVITATWIYDGAEQAIEVWVISPAAADEATIAAIKAKTDMIGSGPLFVVSPIAADGRTITLYAGTDYLYVAGTAISWTSQGGLPDLTTATAIKFTIGDTLQVDGVARSATTVTVDLTALQTSGLATRRYNFALDATIGGHEYALARGFLIVKPAIEA